MCCKRLIATILLRVKSWFVTAAQLCAQPTSPNTWAVYEYKFHLVICWSSLSSRFPVHRSLPSSKQQNSVHRESKAASCSIKVLHQSFYTVAGMGWHSTAFQGEHSPFDLQLQMARNLLHHRDMHIYAHKHSNVHCTYTYLSKGGWFVNKWRIGEHLF